MKAFKSLQYYFLFLMIIYYVLNEKILCLKCEIKSFYTDILLKFVQHAVAKSYDDTQSTLRVPC